MENTSLDAPKRNLPRDVFLHLFAMVALYWSAISFITLCWQYVNYFFPNVVELRYAYQPYVGAIRFAVASLIVMFPLFIFVSWYLNKIYRKEAVVRDSKIRKWLIYLTLFIASLIIIGDLVAVIYNFLGGDVTIRFVLKALSVLGVAGAIFGYYLDDIRKSQPSPSAKYFAWGTGALVVLLVIGAFFIVGSPESARLMQADEQRASDLYNIQWQIVNYYQRKGQLPTTLANLNDPISSYMVPNDPETNQSYEYRVKDAQTLTFELCAVFNLEGSNNLTSVPKYPGDQFSQGWEHGKGRTCFERTIDKELYPLITNK